MEPEIRLEVEYQLEFGEFYRGLRWYAWRKCWWLYLSLIFALPMLLMAKDFQPDNLRSHPIAAVFPGMLASIFVVVWLYWGIRRSARKQFDSNQSLRAARHSIFSDEGVEGSSSLSSGRTSWTVLHKVLETPESFLFFNSNATFGVFPKRVLGTDERVKSLRELIQRQVGSKAKLRKG